MKIGLKSILIIAGAFGFASSLMATKMQVLSPEASTGYTGLSADGTSLTTFAAGSWTFQAGAFSSGFNPAEADFSTWEANFTALVSTNWVVSPPFAAGKIDALFDSSNALAGRQGYVWGFNQTDNLATAEWVLLTNDAWSIPTFDALSTAPAPENIWNLATPTNTFIVGSQLENGFQTQAIPEPSTYALIFGLGALGFLGFRRLRK